MVKRDIDELWMKLTDAVDIDRMTVEQATSVYEVFSELIDQIEYLEAKIELYEAYEDICKPEEKNNSWMDDFSKMMDIHFTTMREKGDI